MTDSLVINKDRYCCRIGWICDGDNGATLGESLTDGTGDAPASREDWEHWIACRMAQESKPERDAGGFRWETEKEARAVLRTIKEAWKQDRPLPEWAKTALTEGWKPPKGWKA